MCIFSMAMFLVGPRFHCLPLFLVGYWSQHLVYHIEKDTNYVLILSFTLLLRHLSYLSRLI